MMKKEIHISTPYIEARDNDLYRVCADIDVAGVKETVFVEVEKQYKDYLLVERADPFVFLTIPIALREGYDIRSDAPVTEMFMHNLREIMLPAFFKNDERCEKFSIIGPTDNTPIFSKGGVGTSVTCGVDSTYSIMKYTRDGYSGMKLTHLLVGSISLDLWGFDEYDNLYSWEAKYPSAFERYRKVSEYTGLPIVKVFTNFIPFITNRKSKKASYRHVFTNVYITLSVVLALKKLFSVYLSPSGYDFSHFDLSDVLTTDPAHYELLFMHTLSHPDFMLFTEGGCIDRMDKTVELADYPLARKILHPCFWNEETNCSSPTCDKCKRALFAFDYCDKLDEMSEVYDVERYRRERDSYLVRLVELKESAFYSRLYELFVEKYPEDMKRAEEAYQESIRPITREEYDQLVKKYNKLKTENEALKGEHDTSLMLLSETISKDVIVNYFKSKNINRLYYAGKSRFGRKILELLGNEIKIVTVKTGDVNSCDAVFIASPNNNSIQKITKELLQKMKTEIPIYNVQNLKEFLMEEKREG